VISTTEPITGHRPIFLLDDFFVKRRHSASYLTPVSRIHSMKCYVRHGFVSTAVCGQHPS